MRILIHICCANCLIYPLKVLREEGHEVVGFFYNPNIHPALEYIRRRETLKEYVSKVGLEIIWEDEYGLERFLEAVFSKKEQRCEICYWMRLEETACTALRKGFDAFTTTLLYSKYQKYEKIIEVGRKMAEVYKVPFLERDFRIGWKEGIEESKRLGLYRQPYCGCIFSEKERFWKQLRSWR